MALTPWKKISSNYLLKRPTIAFRIDQCETHAGVVFEPYIIECGAWVNVIALTKDREVLLVKQYRHGVEQIMLEIPAGVMDPDDESPEQAARRELLEETGYTSDRFIEVGRVYPNPATHNNLTYSFLALNAEPVSEQHLDATEEIEVSSIPFDEFVLLAKGGGLPQALHVAALFFAMTYLERSP